MGLKLSKLELYRCYYFQIKSILADLRLFSWIFYSKSIQESVWSSGFLYCNFCLAVNMYKTTFLCECIYFHLQQWYRQVSLKLSHSLKLFSLHRYMLHHIWSWIPLWCGMVSTFNCYSFFIGMLISFSIFPKAQQRTRQSAGWVNIKVLAADVFLQLEN